MILSILRTGVFPCVLLIISLSCFSQSYPVDTITIITHSSPGGGSDVFLRELSRYLAAELEVNIVIKNVTGGSGATAIAELANAKADGSKFYATTPTFIYTSLLSRPAFSFRDVEPLVNMFTDPELIYTASNSPFHNLDDVLTKARTTRGTWGAANPSSLERQALEQLKAVAGVNAAVISHEGGGDLMINVLNGTLDIGVGEAQELKAQLEAGKLRLLATFSDRRLTQYPDLPTVQEQGLNVVVRKFRGFAGPKGLPSNIINRWEQAIQAILKNPDYMKSYTSNNLRPDFLNNADYKTFIEQFVTETENFMRSTGIIE